MKYDRIRIQRNDHKEVDYQKEVEKFNLSFEDGETKIVNKTSKRKKMISAKERIQPLAYQATEIEHRCAYYRYLLENICDDILLEVDMASRGELKNTILEDSLKIIYKWYKKWREPENANKEAWEVLRDYEEFKKNSIIDLSDAHCGDCVYIPTTCMRCYSERLYDIPNTTTWNSGSEGWRLYNEAFPKEDKQ